MKSPFNLLFIGTNNNKIKLSGFCYINLLKNCIEPNRSYETVPDTTVMQQVTVDVIKNLLIVLRLN